MQTETKTSYFDSYWEQQDLNRVQARASWRATQLHQIVGDRYQTLLDVGAGQGDLVSYFATHGYQISAWDISPAAVHALRQQGVDAHLVDIESAEPEGQFDLVCCCEVLQQLNQPYRILRKLANLLKPEGRVFVSVPNEFHILRRLGVGEPMRSHISLFSPNRARWLVEVAELEIDEILFQPLSPPQWRWPLRWFGQWLSRLSPSLFSLSTLLVLRARK
jgi:2-polyprenyl-3-methyl-5-hydroxy-6-metoxy-1,4-benzoquinol methylase